MEMSKMQINKKVTVERCDTCNITKVIPARLKRLSSSESSGVVVSKDSTSLGVISEAEKQ
jgi:hypothetical protein